MVLTQREIIVGVTVVVALNSQVSTVWRQFEESFCETETAHLGLEQYTGICQALWDRRSIQNLDQTPIFLTCVHTCLFPESCNTDTKGPEIIALPVNGNERNKFRTPSALREVGPAAVPFFWYGWWWTLATRVCTAPCFPPSSRTSPLVHVGGFTFWVLIYTLALYCIKRSLNLQVVAVQGLALSIVRSLPDGK